MERKVILRIEGEQTDPEGVVNTMTLVTQGKLVDLERGMRLSYLETEMVGTDGAEMTIEMEDGAVRVFREGDYSSNFLFRKGQRCVNMYRTPFGVIELGAFPSQVEYGMSEGGGTIQLCYDLEMQGRYLGMNRLVMEWTTQEWMS